MRSAVYGGTYCPVSYYGHDNQLTQSSTTLCILANVGISSGNRICGFGLLVWLVFDDIIVLSICGIPVSDSKQIYIMYIVNMALQVVEYYDKLKQLTSCFGRRLLRLRIFGPNAFLVERCLMFSSRVCVLCCCSAAQKNNT